jgi:hypothetical protein
MRTRTIENHGLFTLLVSALAAGDREALLTLPGGSRAIQETLATLADAGMARVSRKGWYLADHPKLGQLSWKSGWRRCAGAYLVLRLNGREVARWWPQPGAAATSLEGDWEVASCLGPLE